MKSIFIDIDQGISPLSFPTVLRAWMILSVLLRWIFLSVVSLRLCIQREIRPIPRERISCIYHGCISSGLHSKDISRFTSQVSGKQSKISLIS